MINPFICFIHIQRSGGTSFHHILRNNYFSYISIRTYSEKYGNELSADQIKKIYNFYSSMNIKGIGGHTLRSYKNYEEVVSNDIFYMTFLRDPVSRYISHYNYINGVYYNNNFSFDTYLENPSFNNFQTKVIGNSSIDKAIHEIRNKFDFVGLNEKYNESLVLFKSQYGNVNLDICYEIKNQIQTRSNTYIKHHDLSNKQMDKAQSNNLLDSKLYDYVSQYVYPSQQQNYGGNLEKDLQCFLNNNSNFKKRKMRSYLVKIYRYLQSEYFNPRLLKI